MARKSAIVPGPVGVSIGWSKYSSSGRGQRALAHGAQVVPLGEHLGTRPGTAGVDLAFVELADRVADVRRRVARQRLGSREPFEQPLGADHVGQRVLDAPAGQVGRRLPVLLGEPGADVGQRLPRRRQRVDDLGRGTAGSSLIGTVSVARFIGRRRGRRVWRLADRIDSNTRSQHFPSRNANAFAIRVAYGSCGCQPDVDEPLELVEHLGGALHDRPEPVALVAPLALPVDVLTGEEAGRGRTGSR